LIDTLKGRKWQINTETWRQIMRLIIEGMIEGTRSRGRPRMRYISQVIQDAGVTSYKELKNMANDRERWRRHLL